MSLVTAKEIAKVIKFDKFGAFGTFIGWLFLKLTRISEVDKVYISVKHLKGVSFLDGLLNGYKIKYEIPEEDLKRLPKEGSFITVSNHPLGGIDGILLMKLIENIGLFSKAKLNNTSIFYRQM